MGFFLVVGISKNVNMRNLFGRFASRELKNYIDIPFLDSDTMLYFRIEFGLSL